MFKKLLLGTLVAASILGTSAVANAGYWFGGVYFPTCGYVWNGFYWIYVCG